MSHLLITHQGISDFRPLDYSEGKRCEGKSRLSLRDAFCLIMALRCITFLFRNLS